MYCKQSYHKRFIKKYATYFLTPSDNLTESIKNHFSIEGETLPNPLLLENENQLPTEKEEYLLYVGRLDKEKGVLSLLKAFQNILINHPDEKLLIVGEGNQMQQLVHYKNKHNLKNIVFDGSMRNGENIFKDPHPNLLINKISKASYLAFYSAGTVADAEISYVSSGIGFTYSGEITGDNFVASESVYRLSCVRS